MFSDLYFQYLGCVEVFESRGMQVCEEAVKTLKTVSNIGSPQSKQNPYEKIYYHRRALRYTQLFEFKRLNQMNASNRVSTTKSK